MAKAAPEIPNKLFYKIGEVCEITDTQPYVLRFWESEFPQLAPRKNRSGQRVYQRKDIDTVLRIKKLLYEEEYTIAGARKKLDEDPSVDGGDSSRPAVVAATPASARHAGGAPPQSPESPEPRPPRSAAVEHDHPVDLLAARLEKHAGHAAAGRSEEPAAGDAQREARLDRALAELKKLLKESLALLSRD